MAGSFLVKRLKEKFGDKDSEDDEKGFPEMNYTVGVSTGMDIGEFPTPLDERIGYASMTGGEVMELQITNPATFTLERDAMISTVDQLGIDITTHPDMNAGFCSAERSGRGEQYGYDTIEQYFTDYLQELAQFKKHVEKLEDEEPLFKIGRMNPHISTTPQPPLNERMANDVGVDPFGHEINKYDEDSRKKRNYKKQNIFKNPEFLSKLYHTLFLELADYPFQQYQTFASYSSKFDKKWLKARHIAAWEILDKEAGSGSSSTLEDKIGTILTALQQDQGITTSWTKLIKDKKMKDGIPKLKIYTEEEEQEIQGQEITVDSYTGKYEIEGRNNNLEEALTLFSGQNASPSRLRSLDRLALNINDGEVPFRNEDEVVELLKPFVSNSGSIGDEAISGASDDIIDEILDNKDIILNGLEKALDDLWNPDSFDKEDQFISQQAKWQSLQSYLEVENIRLFENAYEIGRSSDLMDVNLEELAAEIFSGENLEDYFNPDDREKSSAEAMHEDMLERIMSGQQFQREMWKESIIFYHILPAWMSCSDMSNDDHEGWDAPKFIWETTVLDKWDSRDDVDLDLESPRNGVYDEEGGENVYHYLDLLEESDEFQRDVAAAVGACYAWGHFTQRSVQFDLKGRDYGLSDEEEEEVENNGWTWIKWMNKFGLGVNLETMQGSPQQRFKVWRPKDIAVTAHAINLTAQEELEDLNPEIDGRPAKFTIDMEHVATLGAPPLDEMERFIDQEGRLAEENDELDLDSDKPISTILRQMHLMDPGVEGQRGTYHGSFERGNKKLYSWLYRFVEEGFTRNEDEEATVLFELAEHNDESNYMMRLTMDLIELGVEPKNLDPNRVTPGEEPEDEEEALIARFFGMEQVNYNREWAKIEQHAFDPLKGLLEAEEFDYTYSSKAAIENDNRPQEFGGEEYQ